VSKIALDALPADASAQLKDSAQADVHYGDLTKVEDVTKVFEQYGKGGIWGVIHVAVSGS
jgi:UDP-glucose 4-epimerase